MKLHSGILLVLLLSACDPKTVKPTPQAPVVVGTQVDVAVRETCKVELPTPPVWKLDTLPADAPMFDKAKALIAELQQRIAYDGEVRAAAVKCN